MAFKKDMVYDCHPRPDRQTDISEEAIWQMECQSKHTSPKPGAQSSDRTIRVHNRPAATRLFTTQPSPWQQGQIASTSGSDFSSCERKKKAGKERNVWVKVKKIEIFCNAKPKKTRGLSYTWKRIRNAFCLFVCFCPQTEWKQFFILLEVKRTEWSRAGPLESHTLSTSACLSRFS